MAEPEDSLPENAEQKPEADESNGIDKAKARLTRRRIELDTLTDDEEPAEEAAEWMMTYMDTVTLLVTLFVLLMSVHTDEEKYRKVASSLNIVMGGKGILEETIPVIVEPMKYEPTVKTPNLDEDASLEEIKNRIIEQGMPDLVNVRVIEDQINLEINENVLFNTGQADLTLEGRSLLGKLKAVLDPGNYGISVEGHTDDVPIANEQFPSNWELSGGRASIVVRFFIENGIVAKRLQSIGHADTRPVGDNATPKGRARNRRVNLILKIGKKK